MLNHAKDHAKDQAAAQYSSIVNLVYALTVDFERLEDLQDNKETNLETIAAYAEKMEDWQENVDAQEELEELAELLEDAAGYTSEEEVREAIQEDPLSVEVRSGWHSIGDELEASEFRILLCTGGPAVQIRGELDEDKTPCRAWLEYQDWGTPWTQFFDASQETLLTYCQQLYFGE